MRGVILNLDDSIFGLLLRSNLLRFRYRRRIAVLFGGQGSDWQQSLLGWYVDEKIHIASLDPFVLAKVSLSVGLLEGNLAKGLGKGVAPPWSLWHPDGQKSFQGWSEDGDSQVLAAQHFQLAGCFRLETFLALV